MNGRNGTCPVSQTLQNFTTSTFASVSVGPGLLKVVSGSARGHGVLGWRHWWPVHRWIFGRQVTQMGRLHSVYKTKSIFVRTAAKTHEHRGKRCFLSNKRFVRFRFGRKPPSILGYMLFFVLGGATSFSPNYVVFLILRCLMSVFLTFRDVGIWIASENRILSPAPTNHLGIVPLHTHTHTHTHTYVHTHICAHTRTSKFV